MLKRVGVSARGRAGAPKVWLRIAPRKVVRPRTPSFRDASRTTGDHPGELNAGNAGRNQLVIVYPNVKASWRVGARVCRSAEGVVQDSLGRSRATRNTTFERRIKDEG